MGRLSWVSREAPRPIQLEIWVPSSEDSQEGSPAWLPVCPAFLLLTRAHKTDFVHECLANTHDASVPGGQGLSLVCRTFGIQTAGSDE